MITIRMLLASLFVLFMVTACGGGGNSSDTFNDTDDDSNSSTTQPEPAKVLALGTGFGDSFTSGAMSTTPSGDDFAAGTDLVVTVNVVDTNDGNALLEGSSVEVFFTSTCVANDQATIDSSVITATGVATASYRSGSCEGQDTITAVLSSGARASVTFDMGIRRIGSGQGGSFTEGQMSTTLSGGTLSYAGELVATVNIVSGSGNELVEDVETEVSFTSDCVVSGDATIDSTVITRDGIASATYSAGTCEGEDTITASLTNGSRATTTFTVANQIAGSIAFLSASPSVIALKSNGSSSLPEVSTLRFQVLDGLGLPVVGREVVYSLSTEVGGVSLSAQSSVTDSDGVATIFLQSGTANIAVTVEATVDNGEGVMLTTVSGAISIVGALPDQNSFSLSAEVLNPGGAGVDGLTTTLTIRAADRNNNPAPSSTAVSFVTDGGSVVGACVLSNGACSVVWTSQNPRPVDGIVNILARTVGEESFTDANANGLYDDGETILQPLDEAYNDENSNGSYDVGEFFSDIDESGDFTVKPDALFQGGSCSESALAVGHCARVVDVRASGTLCMSSDNVDVAISNYSGVLDREFTVTISDSVFGLTPPAGTQIEVEGTDIVIDQGDAITQVPTDECRVGGYSFNVVVSQDGTLNNGSVVVKVTQRNGDVRSSARVNFFFL